MRRGGGFEMLFRFTPEVAGLGWAWISRKACARVGCWRVKARLFTDVHRDL